MSHQGTRAARLWAEPALVAAAWVLLLVLSRAGPLTFSGVFGRPFLSVAAAVFALVVGPGLVLWRWLVGGPGRHAPAWACGLGAAWVMLPCTVAMVRGATPDQLMAALVALNGVLTAAFLAERWHRRGAVPGDAPDLSPARPTLWLVGAAALVTARLLDVATRRLNRLTYGGDEWIFLRALRLFVDGPTVADPYEFDVWDLLVAQVVRLSRVEVFETYRVHLPPLMVVAAALAFLVLAETLLRDRGLAWLALCVQGLYALADMHTRGEGLGMAWLVREVEDKYVALLLALPLAQAAFLGLLRQDVAAGAKRRLALAFTLLALAATVMQPFAVPWLALTCGLTCVSALATGLLPRSRRLLLAAAGIGSLAVAAAALLRAMRPQAYFALNDRSWTFNATLIELSFRQLLILSMEKGWYMAHPWLLTHPMTIAGLLAGLFLATQFRRSLSAQWLGLSLWVPVLLVFNPLTAVLLGRVVTPWRLYRLLWSMPVALALAAALGRLLPALETRLAARFPRLAGRRLALGPLAVAALAALALLLDPWTDEAARALRARNRVLVKPSEKVFLHEVNALAAARGLGGIVLAPEGVSVRLPAWTTRFTPFPGLFVVRDRNLRLLSANALFHEAEAIGPAQVALLNERGARYVIAETSSPLEGALRQRPDAFPLVYRGEELALYEWRPERWTGQRN